MKKREQCSLLQGTAAIWHCLQEQEPQANSCSSVTLPKALSPLLHPLSICSSWTCFYWPDLSVSSTLLQGNWQPRQKIQDILIQGKRTAWQVVDPRGTVTSPSGFKPPTVYYYYRALSRLTLKWILHSGCVSGHWKEDEVLRDVV